MPKITLDDVEFISTQPRVAGKVILDDWQKTLRFEDHRWIKSFKGIDDNKWVAPLTSRGEEIINTYHRFESDIKDADNIESASHFFK